MKCTTIGVDLAKSVFQVLIANQAGRVVNRKGLSRSRFDQFVANQASSQVVMEPCATHHYWARKAVAKPMKADDLNLKPLEDQIGKVKLVLHDLRKLND